MAAQQTASAKLMEYLINKNENQATTTSSPHSVHTFLAGVAPTLKTNMNNPYYLNLAKSEIFASVQKYEMKMLMEQQSHERRPDSDFLHNMTPHSEHYSTSISSASTPLHHCCCMYHLLHHFKKHTITTFQDYNQNSSPCTTAIPNITDNALQN